MTIVCIVAEVLALLGYLTAAVLYPQRLLRPESRSTRYAHWGLLVGAALQGLGLLAHLFREGGQAVFSQWANATFVFVVLVTVGLLMLEKRFERPSLGAFLAPVIFLLVVLTVFHPKTAAPILQNPWFWSHIVLTLLAYACFGVAFGLAMAYLLADSFLKRKQLERLPLLPPLDVSDHAAHVAVAVGLPLFSLGLGIGAAFLISIDGAIDLKGILATLTWIVYAAYLWFRDVPRWRGRRLHLFLIAGFALVLLNFLTARHGFQVPGS